MGDVNIRVYDRPEPDRTFRYAAEIDGEPGTCQHGLTPLAALGHLVNSLRDRFGVAGVAFEVTEDVIEPEGRPR